MSGGKGCSEKQDQPSRRAVLASVVTALPAVSALLNGCDSGSTENGGKDSGKDSGGKNDGVFRPTRPPQSTPSDVARGWPIRIAPSSPAPALGDDALYCAEYGGLVRALDAGTGRERWRFTPPPKVLNHDGLNQETPLPGDGVVVVGRHSADPSGSAVLALDARKGSTLWTQPISYDLSLTRWQDLVIYSGSRTRPDPENPTGSVLHGVRARTGRTVWERPVAAVSVLIPLDETLLVAYIDEDWDSGVRALDPATGRPLWDRPVRMNNARDTPVSGGLLIACQNSTTDPAQLTAVRVLDGSTAWERRYGSLTVEPLVDDRQRLYVSADDRLRALDVHTGKELWSRATPPGNLNACITYDGMLIADESKEPFTGSAVEHRLLFLDGGTGEVLRTWEYTAVGAELLLAADGMAYVLLSGEDNRQQLVCVDAARGKRLWARAGEGGTTLVARDGMIYTSNTTIDCLHARTGRPARG